MDDDLFSKIDVDEKGSLDKASVIAGLEEAGEGNYDQVSRVFRSWCVVKVLGWEGGKEEDGRSEV